MHALQPAACTLHLFADSTMYLFAQEAILTSLVFLIGKGMELQADELAAAALAGGKKAGGRR